MKPIRRRRTVDLTPKHVEIIATPTTSPTAEGFTLVVPFKTDELAKRVK